MKAQKTSRKLLADAIVTIEHNFQNLLVLGMELVMFEDRKAGLVPNLIGCFSTCRISLVICERLEIPLFSNGRK